jgi:hypothetical protein
MLGENEDSNRTNWDSRQNISSMDEDGDQYGDEHGDTKMDA